MEINKTVRFQGRGNGGRGGYPGNEEGDPESPEEAGKEGRWLVEPQSKRVTPPWMQNSPQMTSPAVNASDINEAGAGASGASGASGAGAGGRRRRRRRRRRSENLLSF